MPAPPPWCSRRRGCPCPCRFRSPRVSLPLPSPHASTVARIMPQRLREYTAAMARRAAPAVVELNSVTVMQAELFTAAPPLPEGFVYQAGFLAVAEEDALLDVIRTLPFEAAKYK